MGLTKGNETHFFMMMYRSAFPRVWPSSANSNDAAVAVDPGSWIVMVSIMHLLTPDDIRSHVQA